MFKIRLTRNFLLIFLILLLTKINNGVEGSHETSYTRALECYDEHNRPQRCLPEFVNAAYQLPIEATNNCGRHGDQEFCVQTGYSNQKSCDICTYDSHPPEYLTDLHDPHNPTWWQSETMYDGVQNRNQVNLTLHLGKSFDIIYIRLVFYSPRPESFAIYKRVTQNGPWIPYQYYSSSCRDTYNLPDSLSIEKGQNESRALCTGEYSDISPLRDGNIAFSSLEGRPSSVNFDNSPELQNWVTATDIRISLDRLNTFGDEVFGDAQVLRSYFFAIADIAVGARCKCNGHASKCVYSTGLNRERSLVCECKHNTDGPDCERCLPLFNDAPWRRGNSRDVNECKPCNCNGLADTCFFDSKLYNLTGHGGHCIDCRENRDGPNCERCKENFYMREDGYCIHCDCNAVGSRSLQCNSEGKCQCKPGVTGDKCDRCDENYYQFGTHGCQPCGCDTRGSRDNKPSCKPESGVCYCKENVEGRRCKECKPGFFNLDLENRFGCTPCFCYGHTSECTTAPGYSIVSTTSNFNRNQERWTALDNFNRKVDLKYNHFSQSIGTIAHGNEYIYFSASDRFLGDQRASYNRLLKFRLQLVGQVGPNPSRKDVIIEGVGKQIALPIFAQGNPVPDHQLREYVFRLHEHSDYQWQPSQSARAFMSILSNVTGIKIRASYALQGEAILDDVELQSAHRGAAGHPANWIEQCTCPEGYIGQFCESCAPGFHHSPAQGGPFMRCVPCNCHKHADFCDAETGKCICKHNTAGDNCDQCARGYYGNALNGTPEDCIKCPCPENGACLQLPDGSTICTECPVGYFGAKCESCADGYFGDPTGVSTGIITSCLPCDCNNNTDPNAVGNCERINGECLKCIYNTAGRHCDECLEGYYGDPLAPPHGQCEQCECYPAGTIQSDLGISKCDLLGNCYCKPNIIGKTCNECLPGFFNIASGNGCESCNCNLTGSYNETCNLFTGQCHCKPGVTGKYCDQCEVYHYGFSSEGCKPCDCDDSGSKSRQCDHNGQCPCNDNVEGRRCDRCKENKYNRHEGCLDCPYCYNLVQDAANDHRAKLRNLSLTLDKIATAPVANDEEFDSELRATHEKIQILLDDAKAGAGGDGQTVLERLNELQRRLDDVKKLLEDSDDLQISAEEHYEQAKKNFTSVDKSIEEAEIQLQSALDLLGAKGYQALEHAREKAQGLGSQSDQISAISREARSKAKTLQSEAEFNLKKAKEANEAAIKAHELAKSALTTQSDISDELKSNIPLEMTMIKKRLGSTKHLAEESLKKSNETYDTALTLFTTVNGLVEPDVNVGKLKEESNTAFEEAENLEHRVGNVSLENDQAAIDFEDQRESAIDLIEKAQVQKADDIALLIDAEDAYENALKAVALGNSTFMAANATYHQIAGFEAQVQNYSAKAQLALQAVPGIRIEIDRAEMIIEKADDALYNLAQSANETRKTANEAQEKYAEEASKEAGKIRKKANETKVAARKLRSEADQLDGRVTITEAEIQKLEELSREDDQLVDDVKKKVGQAKADSVEAQNQAQKALDEVQAVMDELRNIRDISDEDLLDLERKLESAEAELKRTNITARLDALKDTRNRQNKWLDQYEKEVSLLQSEVNIIKQIADSLPGGCYKRSRLEP